MLLAARSTSVEEFGQFAIIITIVGMQLPITTFGLNIIAYGRAASRPRAASRLMGSSIVFTFTSGVALYFLTILWAAFLFDGEYLLLCAGAGMRLLGATGILMSHDAMARHALSEYLPARLIATALAAIAATAAFLASFPLHVLAFIWGAEALCFSLIVMIKQSRQRAKINIRNRYKPLLMRAVPIAVQGLLIVLYLRFDQIYVGYRFGAESLAIYATAAKITELGNLVFNVLTLVVSPLIIYHLRRDGAIGRFGLLFLFTLAIFTVLICGIFFFTGSFVLEFVFGSEYAKGGSIMAVYAGSICFVAYGSIASRALAALGVSGPQAWSGMLGLISNVLLSIVFGELLGLEGVALATVFSYALAIGVLWRAVRKKAQFIASSLKLSSHGV